MKVVQTTLSDSEHRLLESYAARKSKTIKEAVREAIRKIVIEDRVLPDDSLFGEPPSGKTGKSDDASVKHDFYLYGAKRRR